MDRNDFEMPNDSYTYTGTGYYGEPRWNDFTIDDEKRARGRFSRFFISVSAYMIISILAIFGIEFIISLIFGDTAKGVFESNWYPLVINLVGMYVVALPILWLLLKGMKNVFRSKSKMSAKNFIILFFISQALMMLGSLIGNVITSIISVFLGRDIIDQTSELIMDSPIWLVIIIAVIIGPIVEELIFRKFLMDKLGMYGDRIAIIVSAVAFGIFHGNLYQLFYAAMLGAVLAYIYSKTSNILYPIAMHILINLFGTVPSLLLYEDIMKYTELAEKVMAGAEYDVNEYTRLTLTVGTYSIIQYAMVVVGIYFIYKLRKTFFVSDRCEIAIPKEKRASVILANVGSIIFIILSIATIILDILMI